MNAEAIAKALGGAIGLGRCPVRTHGKGRGDQRPSLSIRDGADGRLLVYCHAGCDARDVFAELRRLGLDEHVHDRRLDAARASPSVSHLPDRLDESPGRTEVALRLWNETVPLIDTLGWRYFAERRFLHIAVLNVDHCLRWHPSINAVVALMTDAISGTATGIHRTYIDKSVAKIGRKMLGRSGVIRLSPDTEVNQGLGICEGLEDGLALLLAGWSPVWVATSAGAIRRFPILLGVESLTIFSDDGKVGAEAAQECAARWRQAGVEVLIAWPGGNDD